MKAENVEITTQLSQSKTKLLDITTKKENAEASILQPFTYFQLLFASIIGICFFNDKITLSIFVGGSIVVLSGIFAAWRNHVKNKKTLIV